MTPQDFEKLCKEHLWSFQFSDDHRVWMEGHRGEATINDLVRKGNNEIRAIYLDYCFLPWEEHQVVNEYEKIRTKTDQLVGVEARKAWEARTTIDPMYASLPRFKQGWWWLCELSRFLEKETGETDTKLGTWNNKHLHDGLWIA